MISFRNHWIFPSNNRKIHHIRLMQRARMCRLHITIMINCVLNVFLELESGRASMCGFFFSQAQMLGDSSNMWRINTEQSYLNTPMVGSQPPTKTHTCYVHCGQKPTVTVEAGATRSRDGGRWHIRMPTGSDNCLLGRAKRGNAGVHGKAPVHEQHEPEPWQRNSVRSGFATLAPLFKRTSLY